MKKIIVLFCFVFVKTVIGQVFDKNHSFIVEENNFLDIQYKYYTTPLKLNRVKSQSEIDYSTIKGLLQSFISANNLQWAKDEYLDKNAKISRSEKHFKKVKEGNTNDYIQLERSYTFNNDKRKFSFVKYSIILEQMPFPWTSVLIMEKKDNRWYFSKLINQNQILMLLGNTNDNFLVDSFSTKSNNQTLNKLIKKCLNNGKISMRKLSLALNNFNEIEKKEFYDSRILDESIDFRNAKINSKAIELNFKVFHPFLLDVFSIDEYNITEEITTENKNFNYYKNKPEALIISKSPINLISKIYIESNNSIYHFIKYKKQNKVIVNIIQGNNMDYQIINDENIFNNLAKVFKENGYNELRELIINPKEIYKGSDGGVNLSALIEYINSTK